MDMSMSYTSLSLADHETVKKALQKLPAVFDLQTISNILRDNVPTEVLNLLSSTVVDKKRVPIQWERKGIDLYTLGAKKVSVHQLLEAWTKERCYLSYSSALIEHGFMERKSSSDIYLSQDLHVRKSEAKEINLDAMEKSFSRSPRISNCNGLLKDKRIYFIEKKVGGEGVVRKEIKLKTQKVILQVTNVERTLLDATISPFYSGGILSVLDAYKQAKLDLRRMSSIYTSLALTYPYWQRVGFFLDLSGKTELADKWYKFFGKAEIDFYLDHRYNKTWNFDERWRIFHPPLG